jgi:hypothetical protein
MHSEHQFADLAESLRKGLLADQIVLALAHVEQRQRVSDEERIILQKATAVLELAKEGHNWLDTLKVTRQTPLGASYFGQAVEALPQASSSAIFIKNLESLRRTAQQLVFGSQIPKQDQIKELRTFFFNLGCVESDRTDQLLSGENDSKLPSWLLNNE